MKRYELAPERRMLVKCDDGPWVFYADVERLKEQLAEARELLSVATCVCGVDDEWWIPRRDALLKAHAGEEK